MSANDGAASSSNVAAEGNFEPSANNEAASGSNVDIIINSEPGAIMEMEAAAEVNVDVETPLHVAARYGDSDMVKVLIKSSAKPQHEDLESGTGAAKQKLIRMTNNEGDTALHVAVRYGHLDVVKILTREDPDFSYSSNKRGETPLYIAAAAAANNSLEIVVEILETCTSPAYEGPNQMTALHAVAMNFRPDIRRKILEKKKSLIKERDQYGWTPLHYAAYYQNSMETLLEGDISAAYIGDKHRKMTPLHIAISRGYIPNEIISRCPDCCELVDERRWNVLHFAMLSLSIEKLEILLKDLLKHPLIRNLINDKDVDGNTPLHFLATFRSHLLRRIKHEDKDIFLDLEVLNNQNMSVHRLMECGSRQLEQEILKLEEPAGPYLHGVVIINKESGEEPSRRRGGFRDKQNEEFKKLMEKAKESHLIVAALIATVTFTAAFTLPGGVIQEGDNKGTAILSKKAAFQAFVITDAIAMVLSLSAVFAHFLMSLPAGPRNLLVSCVNISTTNSAFLMRYGAYSTMIAMGAMVIAFVTGTYALLTTSLWLAILTTFIGLGFFLLMFLIWCCTVC